MFRMLVVFFSLFVALAGAAGAALAADRYLPYTENRGWTISYDRQDKVCIASPKGAKDGLFFIRPNTKVIVVLIASTKLGWLTHEQDYDIVAHTDRRRWTGTMRANITNGSGGLYLTNPNASFMSALRGASRLSISVDNVSYGPFSLSGSSDTISQIGDCARALERGEFGRTVPTETSEQKEMTLGSGAMIDWSRADFGRTYRGEDWTAVLSGEESDEGTATAVLTVRHRERGETTIRLETGPDDMARGQIGIYPLQWGEQGVVFTSFSGGAHCCTAVAFAFASTEAVKTIDLGVFDGFGIKPADLDGDGDVEFDLGDDRFLYAFSSYVESLPPVRIMALRDGEVRDVTREAAFRPVVERRLTSSMRSCFQQSSAGICAGALGNAALLGYYPAALELVSLEEIDRQMESNFLDCDDSKACQGRKRFKDFAEAVGWRLETWGYQTDAALDDKVVALVAELAKVKDGFASEGAVPESEDSCGMGPLTFEYGADKRKATVRGYEYGCVFGAATLLKESLVVDLLCSGEAEFWLDRHVYERDGAALMSLSATGALDADGSTRFVPCPPRENIP
ncbi:MULTISPECIES: hypothetical protein [Alphaproteobacteria]|uniref:Uncharacterized protein n=2 Tax=Alphaproteobacteria TaxID=28211 RepID=A0A512HMX5_9HYPH|nr:MULTISPECIES: hypothetical protein [Alphaproteobacteria]GEO86802.1 hypothetical protein RNA01_37340 [Ciceribacter naphthalenivorans]GLR23382.1 hypothetical protein GCM10007920_31730 [Ciceribacter naphthalenivorans]GLT06238.1 hypothetical protein GCM10007926_31730 [Sphingomonas psychrolutea]